VWSDEGLLPTQRCVGEGPAGATGLMFREGVITKVALEEPLLAQQGLPERLLTDHALTQQHIGNDIPTKMAYAVASALVRHPSPTPTTGPPASVLGSADAEGGVVNSTSGLHGPLPLRPPPGQRISSQRFGAEGTRGERCSCSRASVGASFNGRRSLAL
jgi:hypothetical protein